MMVRRKELREKKRTERLMEYFKDTRGWVMKQRGDWVRRWWQDGRWQGEVEGLEGGRRRGGRRRSVKHKSMQTSSGLFEDNC